MLTNHILGHFTYNKKAVPPWRDLSEDLDHKFIVPESLPKGMMLADPSRFTEGRVQAFWDHWLNRQSADLQGLVFRKAKPGAMRDASPPRRHRRQKKVDDGTVDFFDDPEKGAGPSNPPHPDSPAAHAKSMASKISFLEKLSNEQVYRLFVHNVDLMEEVS